MYGEAFEFSTNATKDEYHEDVITGEKCEAEGSLIKSDVGTLMERVVSTAFKVHFT